ncbi:MAG: hypothetical protein FJ125_08550, partial [Deltaproteobacteria bacterium]|nr:hypothetical protein [Deltaproteobacteria bacterium]
APVTEPAPALAPAPAVAPALAPAPVAEPAPALAPAPAVAPAPPPAPPVAEPATAVAPPPVAGSVIEVQPVKRYPDHLPGMLSFNPAKGMELAIRAKLESFGGWVGADALPEEGDLMQEPGFRLRRARLGLDGSLIRPITFGLEMDLYDEERAGGPLYEAWVDATLRSGFFGGTLGVQKLPYSQGEGLSSVYLTHLERPLAVLAMSPAQVMGLTLHGQPWPGHVFLSAGLYNGIQRKPLFYQGYRGVGMTEGNRFERLLYAGKLDLVIFGPMGAEIADLYVEPKLRLAVGEGFFVNDGRSIFGLGSSSYLHLKGWGFHLLAELLYEKSEPQAEPTSPENVLAGVFERTTGYVDLGYMLLPQRLGVALRIEWLDSDSDRQDQGDEMILTGTLTYYVVRELCKVMLEATHREELHGEAIDNDAVLAGVQLAF